MSEEMNPTPEAPTESQVKPVATVTPPEPEAETLPPPSAPAAAESKPAWRMFVAPAWFLLGVLVGLGAFFALTQLTAKPAPPPAATLDEATIKKAAREGLIEAIQQLQAQSQQGQGSQGPRTVDNNAFKVRAANRLGNANARVMIVEYADFQCPFCGRHHQAVAPMLIKEYVGTGKATYVYKHMAFLGNESVWAAVAAECAADQGKFWQYHDSLFDHQNGENQGAFAKDKLIAFGKALDLEMTKFEKCVTGDETLARVQADTQEAQANGVSSTPTFFVNGKPLVGLTSPDEFKQVIDQALNQ
ncbi:MAG: DsbA family protein [Chloroflexi bacterium]|nr:DsbA family protein [Chloroflexota bacterium]